MSDIVEELRSRTTGIVLLSDPPQFQKDGLCQRAADEIERLREEVEGLKSEESCNDVLLEYAQAENERLQEENARLREQREFADEALTATYLTGVADGKEQMQAERDALRALLAKTKDKFKDVLRISDRHTPVWVSAWALIDSIDAALNKGGGDDAN